MAARKKYNWDELFKRGRSLLEAGIDYHCSQSNICQQIRNEASKRKVSVRLSDLGNQVVIAVLGAKDEVRDTDTSAVAG